MTMMTVHTAFKHRICFRSKLPQVTELVSLVSEVTTL